MLQQSRSTVNESRGDYASCAAIMVRDVVSAAPELTVEGIARSMRDHAVGFVPVCDTSGVVLGVVTDRDIVVRMTATGLHASEVRVNAIMSRDVISCRADDSVNLVGELMKRHSKLRIVVTDDAGRLAGVVSLTDVVHAKELMYATAILRQVSARGLRVRRPNGNV